MITTSRGHSGSSSVAAAATRHPLRKERKLRVEITNLKDDDSHHAESVKERIGLKNKPPTEAKALHNLESFGLVLLRTSLEFGFLLVVIALAAVLCCQSFYTKYFVPQVELQRWNANRQRKEVTYFSRECGPGDITAESVDSLIISDDWTSTDAAANMNKHGVGVYPNLLSDQTAHELRDFILKHNKKTHWTTDRVPVVRKATPWVHLFCSFRLAHTLSFSLWPLY